MKEFNLSERRKKIEKKLEELIPKIGCGIVNRIIQQIKDQDKEFIERLKKTVIENYSFVLGKPREDDLCNEIDKLVGDRFKGVEVAEKVPQAGITITDVKVVGICSKCRKKGDEIPKNKFGVSYKDEDLACVGCAVGGENKGCGKIIGRDSFNINIVCGKYNNLCKDCKKAKEVCKNCGHEKENHFGRSYNLCRSFVAVKEKARSELKIGGKNNGR